MNVLKNTFGVTISFKPRKVLSNFMGRMSGSSLERKPPKPKEDILEVDPIDALMSKPLKDESLGVGGFKFRSMSARSKSKVRKKIIAFSRLHKTLSFVTLTFVNKVSDRLGIKILGMFLENVTKRSKDFQYIWVAEKQSKNTVFEDNIHFHLITNKFWKIDRWWNYWIEIQAKMGVLPRDKDYKPSSSFDVKAVRSNNIKGLGNYLTKYVTKTSGEFQCQTWNCSRKISQLYTDFYSGNEFLENVKRLQDSNQLGGEIKTYLQEHCEVNLIPLNNITTRFYNRIDERNRLVFDADFDNLKTRNHVKK